MLPFYAKPSKHLKFKYMDFIDVDIELKSGYPSILGYPLLT